MPVQRISMPARMVLKVFLQDPTEELYGNEIAALTGVQKGTLYPLLRRLAESGWLDQRWETTYERREGRPSRKYYRLTPEGQRKAEKAMWHWVLPKEQA